MPAWRRRDEAGCVSGREHGCWEGYLFVGGDNGLLTAILLLRWWWDAMEEKSEWSEHVRWIEALEEVYWVIITTTSVLR